MTRLRSRGKRNSLLGGADRRSDETYRIPPGHLRCQPDTPTPEAGAALCPGRNVHNTHSFLHAPWPLVLHRVHSPLTHIRIQLPGLVSRIDCCAVKALPCNAGGFGGLGSQRLVLVEYHASTGACGEPRNCARMWACTGCNMVRRVRGGTHDRQLKSIPVRKEQTRHCHLGQGKQYFVFKHFAWVCGQCRQLSATRPSQKMKSQRNQSVSQLTGLTEFVENGI